MSDSKESEGDIVIGEGVSVSGKLKVPGKATINGTLDGELTADELTVGPKGKLLGKVQARRVDVFGQTHESVTASEHLIIRSTGQIHGTAAYGNIEIERGGLISGSISPIQSPGKSVPLPNVALPADSSEPVVVPSSN